MRAAYLLATVGMVVQVSAHGQDLEPIRVPIPAPVGVIAVPGIRVLSLTLDPPTPSFGEPFDLHVTLRAAPGTIESLPDTLVPTPTAESAGYGRWSRGVAPADSVDFVATYPVIGFREDLVEYPWIGLEIVSGTGPPSETFLRLGGIELASFAPLDEQGLSSPPRPLADVLGSGWSAWRILAVLALGLAGVAVVGWVGRAGIERRRAGLARPSPVGPREGALRELDRILGLGWHRNGRIDEFYQATGDTLRRYAAAARPGMGMHLTSTELLARLDSGAGAPLATPLGTGERAKFGAYRPDPSTAENDWQAVRDWIRDQAEH